MRDWSTADDAKGEAGVETVSKVGVPEVLVLVPEVVEGVVVIYEEVLGVGTAAICAAAAMIEESAISKGFDMVSK